MRAFLFQKNILRENSVIDQIHVSDNSPVERTEYLEKIKVWREERVIKVVTGIRRWGKSTLLQQYRDYLLSTGVFPEQIIFMRILLIAR